MAKLRSIFSWVLVGFYCLSIGTALADSNQISISDGSAVEPGLGYNSVTGEFGEGCVRGKPFVTPSESTHPGLQRIEFELKKIEDISQLRSGLELNLSAIFGLGSYIKDPKVTYFSENNPGRGSVTLLVRSRVITHRTGIRDLELNGSLGAGLMRSSPEAGNLNTKVEFLASCGNQFVQTVSWGGEFLALVKFETETELKKQKVQGFLGALIAWVEGKAELSKNYSEEIRGINISTKMIRKGGSGESPALEVNRVVEYARNFPNTVSASSGSVPLSAETRSYDLIHGVDRSNYHHLAAQESILRQYEQNILKARALISRWSNVQTHPESYESVEGVDLRGILANLDAMIQKIEASARRCTQDLLSGCVDEDVEWPQISVPSERRQVVGEGEGSEPVGDLSILRVEEASRGGAEGSRE
jgi:hypothetical protein